MTENKRFTLAYEKGNWWAVKDGDITLWKEETIALLNSLNEENEQLKQFIKELTTKGTGRIDLANGYSYSVSAVLTDYRGDVE